MQSKNVRQTQKVHAPGKTTLNKYVFKSFVEVSGPLTDSGATGDRSINSTGSNHSGYYQEDLMREVEDIGKLPHFVNCLSHLSINGIKVLS